MAADDRNERTQGPGRGREPDREAVRQGLDHAPRDQGGDRPGRLDPDRLDQPGLRAGHRRRAARPRRRDLRARVVGQDDARAAGHRPGAEARRAWRPSSTPSTPSTPPTRGSSASTSTTCSCRSRTTASRRSRSSRCWSAPAAWTSSSSTRWRRSCPAPRSRARWARRRWGCRRGSCRRRCASSPASSRSRRPAWSSSTSCARRSA